jgi:hypothetical protein
VPQWDLRAVWVCENDKAKGADGQMRRAWGIELDGEFLALNVVLQRPGADGWEIAGAAPALVPYVYGEAGYEEGYRDATHWLYLKRPQQ